MSTENQNTTPNIALARSWLEGFQEGRSKAFDDIFSVVEKMKGKSAQLHEQGASLEEAYDRGYGEAQVDAEQRWFKEFWRFLDTVAEIIDRKTVCEAIDETIRGMCPVTSDTSAEQEAITND